MMISNGPRINGLTLILTLTDILTQSLKTQYELIRRQSVAQIGELWHFRRIWWEEKKASLPVINLVDCPETRRYIYVDIY